MLSCCDQVNNCLDDNIIEEVVFLLRRKLGCIATVINPVSSKQVHLTLTLVEALVKNCGARLHRAVNDLTFMTEMKKVAKRYFQKSGQQNVAVAELSLDIIQAWGEGFLTRRRAFPNIIDVYHELKKDGLPFKAQYDPSRVPIFTPDGPSSGTVHMDSTDAILASTMTSDRGSLDRGGRGHGDGRDYENGSYRGEQGNASGGGGNASDAMIESLVILVDLMKESGPEELQAHEVAKDLVSQVLELKTQVMGQIESLLLTDEMDAVGVLISINDDASTVLEVYNDALKGNKNTRMSNQEMCERLSAITCIPSGVEASPAGDNTEDLLGFDSPSPRSNDATATATVVSTNNSNNNSSSSNNCGANANDDLLDFLSGDSSSSSSSSSFAAPTSASIPAPVPMTANADPFGLPPNPPLTATGSSQGHGQGGDLLDFYGGGGSGSSDFTTPIPTPKPIPKISGPPSANIPKLAPPPSQSQPAAAPQTQEQKSSSTGSDPTNPFDIF